MPLTLDLFCSLASDMTLLFLRSSSFSMHSCFGTIFLDHHYNFKSIAFNKSALVAESPSRYFLIMNTLSFFTILLMNCLIRSIYYGFFWILMDFWISIIFVFKSSKLNVFSSTLLIKNTQLFQIYSLFIS